MGTVGPMVQLKDLLALVVIGDGVSAAVLPRSRMRRWAVGPQWFKDLARTFHDRPMLTRALGLATAGVGLWWTARLPPSEG